MNHGVGGWVDWNLALNQSGGPNWARNVVDAPVIVPISADRFYKQPMFYALAHFRLRSALDDPYSTGASFSAFVPPNSTRVLIKSLGKAQSLQTSAFVTPTGDRIIVILNGYSN